MKKKQLLLLILTMMLLPMTVVAQSSDAAYPIGSDWTNDSPDNEDKGLAVSIGIERYTDPEYGGGCGRIYVYDRATGNDILRANLYYAGKGLNGNMGNGIYYFKVKTNNGKTGQLGLKKNKDADLVFVSATGIMEGQPFLKESLWRREGCGHYVDPTPQANNERELLSLLREADKDPDISTPGFGNRRLYINSHAKLDPSKPKYAKPKGTVAVVIRNSRSIKATKNGDLKPGKTLLVVDEYDGWCQVRLGESTFGWVPLSAVTLTNVQGTAAVIK